MPQPTTNPEHTSQLDDFKLQLTNDGFELPESTTDNVIPYEVEGFPAYHVELKYNPVPNETVTLTRDAFATTITREIIKDKTKIRVEAMRYNQAITYGGLGGSPRSAIGAIEITEKDIASGDTVQKATLTLQGGGYVDNISFSGAGLPLPGIAEGLEQFLGLLEGTLIGKWYQAEQQFTDSPNGLVAFDLKEIQRRLAKNEPIGNMDGVVQSLAHEIRGGPTTAPVVSQ